METELLTSMNELKTILYIILTIFIIGSAIILILGYKLLHRISNSTKSEKFQYFAQEQMDKGCYEELKTYAQEFLEEKPHHIYAQWYLAKAYFYLEDYENAKKHFEKIAKTELEWRDNVLPYLEELNDDTEQSN